MLSSCGWLGFEWSCFLWSRIGICFGRRFGTTIAGRSWQV